MARSKDQKTTRSNIIFFIAVVLLFFTSVHSRSNINIVPTPIYTLTEYRSAIDGSSIYRSAIDGSSIYRSAIDSCAISILDRTAHPTIKIDTTTNKLYKWLPLRIDSITLFQCITPNYSIIVEDATDAADITYSILGDSVQYKVKKGDWQHPHKDLSK